jgi:hypothetical protein
MSEKVGKFPWNKAKLEAAQLLAEDRLTDGAIAERAGVSDRQLLRWKHHPEFQAKVAKFAKEIEERVFTRGIANRTRRVDALNDRWLRMGAVIEERAAEPEMAAVPGGKTGLLVRHIKSIGSGPAAREVHEYEVDTGLLRELREHEKQAAQELNQWSDKSEVHHTGGLHFTADDEEAGKKLVQDYRANRPIQGGGDPPAG